jgi:aryl-alcohol dehydrogenase-like predicted oxidoreductase
MSRSPEAKILPVLQELGIGVTAYGVLARGLLGGSVPSHPKDYRGHLPRFAAANLAKNTALVGALRTIASDKGVTATQLAIAWVLAQSDTILPIPGCRTRAQLTEALGALSIDLSPADLAQLESAVPPTEVAGTRYDSMGMRALDSER